MSDERDKKDDPTEELKQGLSHLWKAARGMGREVKKEVERTDFGKALDDAGREFVRAAANVVDRIADEVGDLAKQRKPDERREGGAPSEPAPPKDEQGGASTAPPHDDDEFDGVKPKPKDPGAQDGGFRISVDGDDKKKGG